MLINWLKVRAYFLLWLVVICAKLQAVEFEIVRQQAVSGGFAIVKVDQGSRISFHDKAVQVDSKGFAILSFGREMAGLHEIEVLDLKRQRFIATIWIDIRDFYEQRITGVDPAKVTAPAAFNERVLKESKLLIRARAGHRDHNYWREDLFVWPVFGRISGQYGSQRFYNGIPKSPHWGVDIARPSGTPVYAPAGGTIVLAEVDLYYSGGTIVLDHGGGLTSSFLHMSKIETAVGIEVKQGQLIGRIGTTGRSTGPHLDWRMNLNGERIDAELWVPAMKGLCVPATGQTIRLSSPNRTDIKVTKNEILCEKPEVLEGQSARHWLKNMEIQLKRIAKPY